MESIDLKREVEKAILQEWGDFAQAHPHLAAVLDQSVLVDSISADLQSDPQFQSAIEQGRKLSMQVETLGEIVSKFVAPLLRKLL